MRYHYKTTQYKANFLTIVCYVLFVSYSLLLYIRYQYGIVTLSNFIESEQANSTISDSTIWVSALLGTLLSAIPATVLLHIFHFPLRLKAIAFLPSYITLGFLTGISPESVMSLENEIHLITPILLLLVSGILIFLSQVYHEDRGEHAPIFNYLGINILVSCVGILFCISLTNTDRQLHLQLDMAKGIHSNDYSIIDNFYQGETTTNNTITSIQVLNLSKKGKLADELFSLPYLKGSHNLLPDTFPATLLYHTQTLVYGHLKAIPADKNIKVTTFLENALAKRMARLREPATCKETSDIKILADYYLCALLLDRDLNRFNTELPKYYNTKNTLPRHYREALVLHKDQNANESSNPIMDELMDSTYSCYKSLKSSFFNNDALQRKECTMTYPGSYWNYFFYGIDKQR